jgi:hypothetical protein
MKKILILVAFLLLTACAPDESRFKSDVPVSRPSFEDRVEETPQTEESLSPALPDSINLDVPFYPQAPDADWGLPWQEACEEASITLAYYYAMNEELTKEEFKTDVLRLVDWQKEKFGDYIHSTVDQTMQMLEGYYGCTGCRVLEDPTIKDMKKELAAGHVIVAPFAGRMLGNPFYSGEGPYYHMMVLKGYDEKHFITNDVGTKRGLNFIYPYATIMNALHDYLPTTIETAPARVIVIE